MKRQRYELALNLLVLTLVAATSGCAGRQMVSADVPLQRVVLYRNGVGYFERSGQIEDDRLQFRVRREHVSDFLATLTVIDEGGYARSVSFPSLEPDEDDDGLVDVELQLGGGDVHDLTVAYVVETPIWRPSYRVVLEEDRALLQGWAVVQNLSGEDWTEVRMSVTSGAPLSFRSDLGRPVIPRRPMITDTGEVVAAPVHGEISLRSSAMTEEDAPVDESEILMPAESPSAGYASPRSTAAASKMRPAARGDASLRSRAAERYALDDDLDGVLAGKPGVSPQGIGGEANQQTVDVRGLLGSVGELAAGAVHEGVTRYDVADLVTVPNNGSTMVAIINQTIPGEDALLYRPDPAVPGSTSYPMRVVRLTNDSGVLLERGPVAIFQTGALLGQGLLDPLPDGATTSIPFAIERAVAVETARRDHQSTGRLVKIAGGRLTIEQFSQRSTTYRIRNGLDRDTTLYLRHSRVANWEVVEPPEGTEEVENALLLPVNLTAGDDGEFEILERTPTRRVVDLMSDLGAEAVVLYLEGPAVHAAVGPVLRQALEHRERLQEIAARRSRLDIERRELRSAQSDVRQNLTAISGIARARDLRDRLTRRLTVLSTRVDELTNQIVELNAERSEMRVRLAESLRDLTLELDEDEE